jgi:hypothetical protein
VIPPRRLRGLPRRRDDPVILPDSSKAFVACSAGHQVMSIALARPNSPPRPAGPPGGPDGCGPRSRPTWRSSPTAASSSSSNSLSDSISEVGHQHQRRWRRIHDGRRPGARPRLRRQFPALRGQSAFAVRHSVYSSTTARRVGSASTWATAPRRMAFSIRRPPAVCGRFPLRRCSRGAHRLQLALHHAAHRPQGPNAIAVKAFKVQ